VPRPKTSKSRPLADALQSLNAQAETFINRCTSQFAEDSAWLESELRTVKARFTP
jgi:sulfur carrier protein ThiS